MKTIAIISLFLMIGLTSLAQSKTSDYRIAQARIECQKEVATARVNAENAIKKANVALSTKSISIKQRNEFVAIIASKTDSAIKASIANRDAKIKSILNSLKTATPCK